MIIKKWVKFVLFMGLCPLVFGFDTFIIKDIKVQGLERVTEGTVFTYLPLEVGDQVDQVSAARALRTLFDTGFFEDIELLQDEQILVIKVKERASVSDINITGNKDIKTEDLENALRQIGLAEGEVFNQLKLDKVEQELTRQYFGRGKYNVKVDTKVTELERNRVQVDIDIVEGKVAKIRHLNIVGNKQFTDEEIIDEFESSKSDWTSWYSGNDQYSKEKLGGDLEILRSFYLDRGYIDFSIESTQVSISPDKQNIYVTVNVKEGDIYSVSDVKLIGEFVLPEETFNRLISIESGQIFSRKRIENSSENIKAILANIGYAFANVSPGTEVDKENKTVDLTLFIDPGQRVYVRRITFEGNLQTKDEVLRREMRQFEGAWFSQSAVDRSKIRLQRLGFFEAVDMETERVAGTEDLIDVKFKVKERNSGSFQFGLGYSKLQKFIFTLALSQSNFLGTGKRFGLSLNAGSVYQQFDINYLNPYYTKNGVSRGFSLLFRKSDYGKANIADYSEDRVGAGVNFGFPLSEVDRITLGANYDRRKFNTNENTPPSIIESIEASGGNFDIYSVFGQWARDSRNRFFNPNRGSLQQLSLKLAIPGSTSEYYRFEYRTQKLFPMTNWLTISVDGEIGYGDGYSSKDELPFFETFYAGGVRSVRGYEDNSLGPRDFLTDLPLGGALKVVGGIEFVVPTPFIENQANTRLSFFADFGNVYEDFNSFEVDELRASAGVAMIWQAPVGPIAISLAQPFNDQPGDKTETLQFTFGTSF